MCGSAKGRESFQTFVSESPKLCLPSIGESTLISIRQIILCFFLISSILVLSFGFETYLDVKIPAEAAKGVRKI
jgi:hypothetical protein